MSDPDTSAAPGTTPPSEPPYMQSMITARLRFDNLLTRAGGRSGPASYSDRAFCLSCADELVNECWAKFGPKVSWESMTVEDAKFIDLMNGWKKEIDRAYLRLNTSMLVSLHQRR